MTKKKKSARGRPELKPKERRSVLMQFRVTEAEAKQIRKQADNEEIAVSDWMRLQIFR